MYACRQVGIDKLVLTVQSTNMYLTIGKMTDMADNQQNSFINENWLGLWAEHLQSC